MTCSQALSFYRYRAYFYSFVRVCFFCYERETKANEKIAAI